MSGLFAPVLIAGLLLPAANPNLEKCRELEAEFDYQGMVAECSIAAADPNATRIERIEVNRLLGFAHTALGDAGTARVWFLRLLTIDPTHELPNEVSPRFRGAFAKAVEEFARDGKLSLSHEPPPVEAALSGVPLTVSFDVVDKLGRIAKARVDVEVLVDQQVQGAPVSAELARVDTGTAGQQRFEGELPDPVRGQASAPPSYTLRYTLVLENAVGDVVALEPAFTPVTLPRQSEVVSSGGGEGGEGDVLLWAGVATVGGVVLIAAVAGGSAAVYCATVGCGARQVSPPVGYVSVSVDALSEAP
jgi:hypothetical protein